MELGWYGAVFGQSGYEEITREMLFALDKIGVDIQLLYNENWNSEKITLSADDENRLLRMLNKQVTINNPLMIQQKWSPSFSEHKQKYCYTLFETDNLPKKWIDGLKQMEKVFTFSHFIANKWIENGFPADKLKVLPFGIDKQRFTPIGDKMEVLNAKTFKFISNGDFVERKNFEGLLKCFIEEFKANEDVCLIIKTHKDGFTIPFRRHINFIIKNLVEQYSKEKSIPKILIFDKKISPDNMPLFYRGGDCFVLPTKGEGLGMPFAESMACGTPCIASNWSAQVDYINKDNGILVEGKEEIIDDVDFIIKCPNALNHKWFEPDNEDLKKKMRYAFENKNELKKLGDNAVESMKKYEWHNTAIEIVQTIFGGK